MFSNYLQCGKDQVLKVVGKIWYWAVWYKLAKKNDDDNDNDDDDARVQKQAFQFPSGDHKLDSHRENIQDVSQKKY